MRAAILVVVIITCAAPAVGQTSGKFRKYDAVYPITSLEWGVVQANLQLLREELPQYIRPPHVWFDAKTGRFKGSAHVDSRWATASVEKAKTDFLWVAYGAQLELTSWFPELTKNDFEFEFVVLDIGAGGKPKRRTVAVFTNEEVSLK